MTSPETPEPNLPSPPHGVRELLKESMEVCRHEDLHDLEAAFAEAADALTARDQRLAELTQERDEANENLNEALVWQDVALDRQRRAEAAEARATQAWEVASAYAGKLTQAEKERDEATAKFNKLWREHGAELAEALGAAVGQEHLRIEADARSTRAEGLLERCLKAVESGTFRDRANLSAVMHPAFEDAAALLSSISGGEVFSSSSSSLPAHVADATATDALHLAGVADGDYYGEPDDTCPNCGGEGRVAHCWEEWACVDPEGGCDDCLQPCDWCNPPPGRAPPAESSAGSPSEASAGNAGLDEQTISGGEGKGFRQTPEQPQCGDAGPK